MLVNIKKNFGVIVIVVIFGGLFMLTGCSTKSGNITNSKTDDTKNTNKVDFTKEVFIIEIFNTYSAYTVNIPGALSPVQVTVQAECRLAVI